MRCTNGVFFDFETTTDELIHKPYMVCNSETKIQYGERCGYLMLRDLYEKFFKKHNSILLVAHNVVVGYDRSGLFKSPRGVLCLALAHVSPT